VRRYRELLPPLLELGRAHSSSYSLSARLCSSFFQLNYQNLVSFLGLFTSVNPPLISIGDSGSRNADRSKRYDRGPVFFRIGVYALLFPGRTDMDLEFSLKSKQ